VVLTVSTTPPGHGRPETAEKHERAWQRLIEMLKDGTCTPLLGAGASSESIPVSERLAVFWADKYGYPLEDKTNLARVAQYVLSSRSVHDVNELKSRFVRDVLRKARLPDFGNPSQVHTVLAGFALPTFVTTNYDDYMCRALWERNKRPILGISPWYARSVTNDVTVLHDWTPATTDEPLPLTAEPSKPEVHSAARPLVYHLHGYHSNPTSLVLTEDDFIDYLTRLGPGLGESRDDKSVVLPTIREALSSRSVLFIGYSLRDVSFQVLIRTLTRDLRRTERRWGVSIQLPPPLQGQVDCTCDCCDHSGVRPAGDAGTGKINHAAMRYLDEYFDEQNITVFWGSARQFAEDLLRRGQGGSP